MYDGSYYPSVVEAAERRLRKGDRQLYCPECAKWRWPEECAHEGRLTGEQFRLWSARIARQVKRDYPSQEQQYRQEMRRQGRRHG